METTTQIRLANSFKRKYGDRELRGRLSRTEQRFRAVLGNIQHQFAGVTEPTERRPLNGKSAEALTITPDQLLSTLGGIKWGQEASKGDPQRNLAGVGAEGAIWSVDMHPSGSVIVAKFRVVEGDGKKLEEDQSIHYSPGEGTEKPATLTIGDRNQELVFKATTKNAVPAAENQA